MRTILGILDPQDRSGVLTGTTVVPENAGPAAPR
jgi:hypothetical protein